MIDDMGIFRTTVAIAHPARPDDRHGIANVMVDTGSEYTWLPRPLLDELGIRSERTDRFRTADGRVLSRDIGFVILYAGGRSTATIVAFAEEGDMVLLGAHGLEGLNMRVDLVTRELVPAGPVPAAAAA
jgi:predicted aspartyl protease